MTYDGRIRLLMLPRGGVDNNDNDNACITNRHRYTATATLVVDGW